MTKLLSTKTAGIMLLLLVVSLLAWSCGDDSSNVKSPADGITEITRQMMIDTHPAAAPGQDQQLSRVIIPAGKELAPHTHAGTILTFFAQGQLSYTVYRNGTAIIMRDAASAHPTKEEIKPGQTKELHQGDALYEPKGIVHMAKNDGKDPVVLYQSQLMDNGAPPSSPATVTATP